MIRIALVVFFAAFTFACSGHRPSPNDCRVESGIVQLLGLGVDATRQQYSGVAGEEFSRALGIADVAVTAGQSAIAACETARDGGGWQEWLGVGIRAAQGLATSIMSLVQSSSDVAGDPGVPEDLSRAILVMESVQSQTP